MLEGKLVNLRAWEREDIDFLAEHRNDINCMGEYWPIIGQYSKSDYQKVFDNPSNLQILLEAKTFVIQKKDGTRIVEIRHLLGLPHGLIELACWLVPSERKKGYATEAVQLIVDYLFLSKELVRVQAITGVDNFASCRVLEKAGFTKEGIMRKSGFIRGEWKDGCLYSILREEWKEPKILTKTA